MERKPAQLKSTRTPRLGEKAFPRLMITPTLAVLIILTAYPLIFTFLYSFTDYNYLKGPGSAKFVFLKSYISLFQNAYFRQAVLNTIKFTLLAVTLEMVFGLLVAVFVNSLHHGQKTVRTLLLLPYLLPAVTVALSWKMMLSSNYGIVNQALSALGLPVYNWFMAFHDWAEKKTYLPVIDYLKTDAAEAEILTGLTDRVEAAKLLHSWGAKEVLITHNTEVLAYDGEQIYTCPIKARNLSGRTGRGDTTFAGYITERVSAGIPEALQYCTALVSLKMETPGPFQGTREDVLDYIREFY